MGRPKKEIRVERIPGTDRYRIGYLVEPGAWHHTPESSPAAAERWAQKHRGHILANSKKVVNFAKYANGFFLPGSSWVVRQSAKGHEFSKPYLIMRDGHVRNYLIPAFGIDDPRTMTRRYIDDKIIAMKGHGGRTLAPATKYKLSATLAIILDDLVDQGVIEFHPMEGLRPYSKSPVKPRTALPLYVFPLLFPPTHGELIKVWNSPMWAVAMCVFQDTGVRPGELLALRWAEYYPDKRAFVIRHGVKANTKDEIGTTKTGVVKSALLTTRTHQELMIWKEQSRHAQDFDFVFTIDGTSPVTREAVIKAFRGGLKRVGLEGQPWTPYYLRHSYATYNMDALTEKEMIDQMGHSTILQTLTYQHPSDDIVLARAESAREKLDAKREP